ncbi:uncharacterized protein EAE98_006340 [Botrytis deweyae]|uniref:Uncharacterized protein n=1 Tax=Botrytis deweyae TaxID=2478750 RepID=A0ABQ7IKM1_9HELO|nr:uncharacterized protein EAE98_006340 [Botrytis deweyae]KAF7926956.1 hypothetical protein EAE98_006340 [Botrytis deweyae]
MPQFFTDLLCIGMVVGLFIGKKQPSYFMEAATVRSIAVRTTGKRIKSQDKRYASTAPCSSMGKNRRGPSTSKDALPCDQSDGLEQSWLLPGISSVLYRKSEKGFIVHEDNYATPSNGRLADRKPVNQAQDSTPSVIRIVA